MMQTKRGSLVAIGFLTLVAVIAVVWFLVAKSVAAGKDSRLQSALLDGTAFPTSMKVGVMPQDELRSRLGSEMVTFGETAVPVEPASCQHIRDEVGELPIPEDAAGLVASNFDGSLMYIEMLMQTSIDLAATASTVEGECATVTTTIEGRPARLSYEIVPTDLPDTLVLRQETVQEALYDYQPDTTSMVYVGYTVLGDVLVTMTQIEVGGDGDQDAMVRLLTKAVAHAANELSE